MNTNAPEPAPSAPAAAGDRLAYLFRMARPGCANPLLRAWLQRYRKEAAS
jgi:hypothetical protein